MQFEKRSVQLCESMSGVFCPVISVTLPLCLISIEPAGVEEIKSLYYSSQSVCSALFRQRIDLVTFF